MATTNIIENMDRQQILSEFAYQPYHIMTGMIKMTRSAILSQIQRSSGSTGHLSVLDSLPLELLHLIFSMLDLKTLCDVKRTCLRGIEVTESLPQYRDLIRYAPKAMAALGATGLIRAHTVTTMHATLLSPSCFSCNEYGAFVFLPLFERCCYECLRRNQSLWVMQGSQARLLFRLSAASLRQLPMLHSLPGNYWVGNMISRKGRGRLVSVKSAKELAITNGETMESLAQNLEAERTAGLSLTHYHTRRWLLAAPLHPPGQWLGMRPSQANVPNDQSCGMASMPFPWLALDGHVEKGLWCCGCHKLYDQWPNNTPEHVRNTLVGSGVDLENLLYVTKHKARSEADFLQHIEHCNGIKGLAPDVDELMRQKQLAREKWPEKSEWFDRIPH